jgi:acyl-ACP thioesterase
VRNYGLGVVEPGAASLVPRPSEGRIFSGSRRVRTNDASPRGRLRLDALAGYLQDVSADDTAEAELDDDLAWVVRRLLVQVRQPPGFREDLVLTTWCSGTGRSWAERRISVEGGRGASVEAAVIWVRIDPGTGQPLRLSEQFGEQFGRSAGGRRVSARLQLPASPPEGVTRRPWPLRFADFDLLGHMNNTAYLTAVEEVLAASELSLAGPHRAEIEYRSAVERGASVEIAFAGEQEAMTVWLTDAGSAETYAAARVTNVQLD